MSDRSGSPSDERGGRRDVNAVENQAWWRRPSALDNGVRRVIAFGLVALVVLVVALFEPRPHLIDVLRRSEARFLPLCFVWLIVTVPIAVRSIDPRDERSRTREVILLAIVAHVLWSFWMIPQELTPRGVCAAVGACHAAPAFAVRALACLGRGVLIGGLVALALLPLRRGLPLESVALGAVAGVAALAALHVSCADEGVDHLFVGHAGAFLGIFLSAIALGAIRRPP